MLASHNAIFLRGQFTETDDQHEDGCGQTSCVGYVAHGDHSNEEEEESDVVEVALNTEHIVEVAPVADVIPADVDYVDLQTTYAEIFMQTLPMACKKYQVKQV